MKYIFIALLIVGSLACKKGTTPAQYSDALNVQNNRALSSITDFYAALEEDDFARAEKARQNIILICDSAIIEIDKIGAYEGESSFQKATLSYITQLKATAQNQLKNILTANKSIEGLLQSNAMELEQGSDSLQNLYQMLDDAYSQIELQDSAYFEKVETAQLKFAAKYHIKIIEGDSLGDN